MKSKQDRPQITRVYRTKDQARHNYDRLSRFYDILSGGLENKYKRLALDHLSLREGKSVLEVGSGTGGCLERIASSIGLSGKAVGIDLSPGMLKVASRRLVRAGFVDRVSLFCADALQIPLSNQEFDAVFCSFTLELFDTPEIPTVLAEIRRVLKTGGKLGIVCISNEDGNPSMMNIYHCLHNKFPKIVDCRPIYPAQALEIAGFNIKSNLKGNLFGLPVEIVIGEK